MQAERVVTELVIDASEATRGGAEYDRQMERCRAAMAKFEANQDRTRVAMERATTTMLQASGASDNLARSYGAANDNVRVASEGFKSTIVEVASMTNHLKFAALAAYAWSPAVRSMVNPAIAASVAALGPAAVSAGATIVSALSPALLFLGKIALPILAIVIAWKALNALVSQGSDLLEKYGNASRKFDTPEFTANLAKLTTLQDNSDVSLSQQQYAAQLATRLDQAKFRLKEFMKVQFDLNDAALFFQKIWVNVVETIANAADGITKMIGLIGQAWDKLTGLGTQIGTKIGEAIRAALPENIKAALTAQPGAAPKGDFDVDSPGGKAVELARLRKIAQDKITTELALKAAASGDQSTGSNSFVARYIASVNALAAKAPELKKDVADVVSQFDRMEASIARTVAMTDANTRSIGKGVGEAARARAEVQLLDAAQRDGIEVIKDGIIVNGQYWQRIQAGAAAAGKSVHDYSMDRLRSQNEFNSAIVFMSQTEQTIAREMEKIWGKEWPKHMQDAEAAPMRLNASLKDLKAANSNSQSENTDERDTRSAAA